MILPCFYVPLNGYTTLLHQYAARAAYANNTDPTGDAGFLGLLPTMSYNQVNSYGLTGAENLIGVVMAGTYDTSTGEVTITTALNTEVSIGTVPTLSNDQLAKAGYTYFAPPSTAAMGFPAAIKGIENFFNAILQGNSLKAAFERLAEGGPAAVGMGLSSLNLISGGQEGYAQQATQPSNQPAFTNPVSSAAAEAAAAVPAIAGVVQSSAQAVASGGGNLLQQAGGALYGGASQLGSAIENAARAVGGPGAANFVQGFAPGGYGSPFLPQGAPAVVNAVSGFFGKIGL